MRNPETDLLLELLEAALRTARESIATWKEAECKSEEPMPYRCTGEARGFACPSCAGEGTRLVIEGCLCRNAACTVGDVARFVTACDYCNGSGKCPDCLPREDG